MWQAYRMSQVKPARGGFVTKKAVPPPSRKKNLQKIEIIFAGWRGVLQVIGFEWIGSRFRDACGVGLGRVGVRTGRGRVRVAGVMAVFQAGRQLARPGLFEIEQCFGLIPRDQWLIAILKDGFFQIPEVFMGFEFLDSALQSLHGFGETFDFFNYSGIIIKTHRVLVNRAKKTTEPEIRS
jgi:hypothetical protein